MDIGSNSVKTTVVLAGGPVSAMLAKRSQVTRLGDGFAGGKLQAASMERTWDAMAAQIAWLRQSYAPFELVIGATSAVRDADNSALFLSQSQERLGLRSRPYCLSGEEEAHSTFLGASCAVQPGTLMLNADPGGGSTELACGLAGERPLAYHSFQVGAVRWGERFGLEGVSSREAREAALQAAMECISPFAKEQKELKPSYLSVSGGSAFMMASLAAEHLVSQEEYDTPVGEEVIQRLMEELGQMEIEARKSVPGMPEDRANVSVSALVIILALMRSLGFHAFRPNRFGLRQGLLTLLRKGAFSANLVSG